MVGTAASPAERGKALYDKRGGYPSPEVDRRKGARCAACSALLDAGLAAVRGEAHSELS
jgi:hypothetical protein